MLEQLTKPFPVLVAEEVNRAAGLYPPHNSHHESYAVLLEELEEAWAEVKKKPNKRSNKHLLKELVQVGAMAQRWAEDMKLVEGPK